MIDLDRLDPQKHCAPAGETIRGPNLALNTVLLRDYSNLVCASSRFIQPARWYLSHSSSCFSPLSFRARVLTRNNFPFMPDQNQQEQVPPVAYFFSSPSCLCALRFPRLPFVGSLIDSVLSLSARSLSCPLLRFAHLADLKRVPAKTPHVGSADRQQRIRFVKADTDSLI